MNFQRFLRRYRIPHHQLETTKRWNQLNDLENGSLRAAFLISIVGKDVPKRVRKIIK
jgi:hypothetical protein